MTVKRDNGGEDSATEIQTAIESEIPVDPALESAELETRADHPVWPADTPENVRNAWPAPGGMQERQLEWPRPPQISGAIDVAAFIKAQSAFVNEQSGFLRDGRLAGGDEFVHNLSQYSLAQDDYIHALHGILIQLGVM